MPTACGSHTHTTIFDRQNDRGIIYVSSYPNATGRSRRLTRARCVSNVRSFPRIFVPFVDRSTLPVPPTVATEVAFFDAKNDPSGPIGIDDAWSTYWHNDYIYASSGLPSPPPTPQAVCCVRPGQRGLDVYFLLGRRGRLVPPVTDPTARGVRQFRGEKLPYQNPQTQEVRGEDDHDEDDHDD